MKAFVTFLLAAVLTASAQQAPKINRIPPPGVEVAAADRTELEAGLKQLAGEIAKLKANPKFAAELPNVEIFHKSADWALRYDEFFDPKQVAVAKDHTAQGLARAAALARGETPWNTASGLVVRGYRSKIDGSVQPYGLVIPADWKPEDGKNRRLDFWCHGRGEKLSELAFIADRQKNPGEFVPDGAIVCHLYGRYCNANKFAGETDLFEALGDIKKHYPIDERRLVIRGFSMGGASTWQFATHFPGMWAAAAPGAGFAETAEFFHVFAPGKEPPPAWEQKLWRWYDCTTMAANLANTSVVAYSGEIDGQKQAADIMVKYAAQEGITFPHIIGPQTPHKYHPDSKPEINRLVDAAVEKRAAAAEEPDHVKLVTYTLIYPEVAWVKIGAMEKQWERAEVDAVRKDDGSVEVKTSNVARLELEFINPSSNKPVRRVTVDGVALTYKDNITRIGLERRDGNWMEFGLCKQLKNGNAVESSDPLTEMTHGRHKRPEMCGPIDHAFMSRFVFVRPTGKPLNDIVGAWAKAEMEHAIAQWRQVFRGDVTVIDDTAYLEEAENRAGVRVAQTLGAKVQKKAQDSARAFEEGPNIVLWGDISSNKVLAKIANALPLKWNASELSLALGTQKVDAAHHAPIMIYPNPLNPSRYVVLNSGPTFREFAALNNSDQTPKLPDWAIVDITTPPGPKWPGQIVDAGFFDESWR